MDSSLSPKTLLRTVSAAGVALTHRVWHGPPAPARPFRVCCAARDSRRGVMAASLRELLNKGVDALRVAGAVSAVLEEDGTVVDSEEFFASLDDNTTLMLLDKHDAWVPPKGHPTLVLGGGRPRKGRDIARITLDLYKLNPRDLIGCLNIKATFYGMYSMTVDLKCLGAKRILVEMLRVLAHVMQVSGRVLLGTAGYLRRSLESTDFPLAPVADKSSY